MEELIRRLINDPDGLRITGIVTITVGDNDPIVEHNIITTVGYANLLTAFTYGGSNVSYPVYAPTHIGIGSGIGTPQYSDTGLTNPVYLPILARSVRSNGLSCHFEAILQFDSADYVNQQIHEFGLFYNPGLADEKLFSRVVLTNAISRPSGTQVNITWDYHVSIASAHGFTFHLETFPGSYAYRSWLPSGEYDAGTFLTKGLVDYNDGVTEITGVKYLDLDTNLPFTFGPTSVLYKNMTIIPIFTESQYKECHPVLAQHAFDGPEILPPVTVQTYFGLKGPSQYGYNYNSNAVEGSTLTSPVAVTNSTKFLEIIRIW